MSTQNYVTSMKDSEVLSKDLLDEIKLPKFMSNIFSLQKAELLQGRLLFSETHYDREEQILCTIDGTVSIKMVPHVARQELYAG
mmetsp:Transcript_5296/g.4024  ORF Transcript_5296/g.4024 Transcript_5296/m.4024 type:complete len:84 (-) Transcript_5296:366-617(-)